MTRERFIDLVRVEQESLRRFLLALCGGDASLADDIAQDALVRAYVASGSFLGLSKFSTWLFRIAYNCYVDHHRKPRLENSIIVYKKLKFSQPFVDLLRLTNETAQKRIYQVKY